jgi:hypothetical protein
MTGMVATDSPAQLSGTTSMKIPRNTEDWVLVLN